MSQIPFGKSTLPLLAWLLLVGGVRCTSLDTFLFRPEPLPADANPFEALHVPAHLLSERHDIVAEDGVRINTWVLDHDPHDGTATEHHNHTILYCHGNKGNLSYYAKRIEGLWQLGYRIVAFDYRGYGKSTGKPSERGLMADARAVAAAFSDGEVASPNALGHWPTTVPYGFSLGTSICTQLAAQRPVAGLILEAPFSSLDRLAYDATDVQMDLHWFTDSTFDTQRHITQHQGRLLLIHGDNDRFIPPWHSQLLLTAAKAQRIEASFYSVAGASHTTCPCQPPDHESTRRHECPTGFSARYLSEVTRFIRCALTGSDCAG